MTTPQRPIILGIVGDSASGKTTITRGLVNLLGEERVTHVCTDDYHKYDRRERAKLGITALHPDCNYLDILELHLERLHYGQPILKPVYDHSTGSIIRPEYVQPKEFVIVEGLLGFHSPVMRRFYDVKVYLDPPEDLRRLWKVKRDTTKRGYTVEQVLAELDKREGDSQDFIRPQRESSDIVMKFYPPEGISAERANGDLNVGFVLRPTIPHPDLSYLFDDSRAPGMRLRLGRDGGRPADFLEIDGSVTPESATILEEAVLAHFPEPRPLSGRQLGSYQDGVEARHSHPLALAQLLLTYHVIRAYNGTSVPFATPVAALSRVRSQKEAAQDEPVYA
ncbi:MAG: phosphoribulokinase [Deltaproteobacteria bacterium]